MDVANAALPTLSDRFPARPYVAFGRVIRDRVELAASWNHVRSALRTLAIKRTLLLTWAGLPPAGSHQLAAGALTDFTYFTAGPAGIAERRTALADEDIEPCVALPL